MATKILNDWKLIQQFLPDGWEAKATELGALVRKRKIKNAETLLRVLLIHLADGKSLRTTVAYANEVGLCTINDVALLHRLRASEEWLHWMLSELFHHLHREPLPAKLFHTYRIR